MAPKRKQRNENGEAKTSITTTTSAVAVATTVTTRVTRSSSRRDNTAPTKTVDAVPEPPKKKKSKTAAAAAKKKTKTPPPSSPAEESKAPGTSMTIIIEHCKQCSSFKNRAFQVKTGLEKEVAGLNVLVNPEKPRRGCFEIREESGKVFVSLQDLKRPFKPMKELDMDEVISDIIEKIK